MRDANSVYRYLSLWRSAAFLIIQRIAPAIIMTMPPTKNEVPVDIICILAGDQSIVSESNTWNVEQKKHIMAIDTATVCGYKAIPFSEW